MSTAREERHAAKQAAKAGRRAAKADKKRAAAESRLSELGAGEPATPQARGFAECPCPKECSLHGECLVCAAYHSGGSEQPRCLR